MHHNDDDIAFQIFEAFAFNKVKGCNDQSNLMSREVSNKAPIKSDKERKATVLELHK